MKKEKTWKLDDTVEVEYDPNASGGGGGGGGDAGDFDKVVISDNADSGDGPELDDMPSLVDDHDGMGDEDLDKVIEELNDTLLTDEEKEDIRDMVEEHCQEENDSPDDNGEDTKEGKPKGGGKKAGTGAGKIWTFADVDARKVKKKRKWETVIQRWTRMKLDTQFRDVEQWARTNRRFNEVVEGSGMMLPTEMEVEDMFWDEDQIEVWFFQDYSGSCFHLKDRFFKAAASLPPDKFKIRLFTFDTKVYETTLESRKVFGGGGTAFQPIEDKIQAIMKAEKVKYPAAVFVVTDGYGSHVKPQHADRWYWFLSEACDSYVPQESQKFMLRDFE
jgi:hypothetical protein